MAKKKQKNNKKKKNKTPLHPFAYIAISVFFWIVSTLQLGVIGMLLAKVLNFGLGTLYPIWVALLCFYFFQKKYQKSAFRLKYWFMLLFVVNCWLSMLPFNAMDGTDLLAYYFMQVQNASIGWNGGFFGTLMYIVIVKLFARNGYMLFALITTIAVLLYVFYDEAKWVSKKVKKLTEQRKMRQMIQKKHQKNTSDNNEVQKVQSAIESKNSQEVAAMPLFDLPLEKTEPAGVEHVGPYELPSLHLLQIPIKNNSTLNLQKANENATKIIEILQTFQIRASISDVHIGPAVTKYEIKPESGVKVSKVANLQNDIKMALAAKEIRIEAPIPGKSAIGIEVPNAEREVVTLKEVLANVPSRLEHSTLLFALGKNLLGESVFGELNKMPHLLIAGATGSGKSVCVNAIIISIIMRCTPEEVQLLLIDPKKVEFTPYKDIPHLLGPLITDPKDASNALKVVVAMMDERYDLFARHQVKNIESYNQRKKDDETLQNLPYIVVIVDELADLMMVASKEVEASIQRITQLARAAGIHLIIATQRPSVDVITGVIKANIPSRIAFAVSSSVDSRTILDAVGAERLLGNGDMLYQPIGENHVERVQGVYVSDQEVQRICEAVKRNGSAKYNDKFMMLQSVNEQFAISSLEQSDVLYDEVRLFVITTQKASTSLIQRKFSIGYARAARLIDLLETNNVIGPSRGSKPREVFIKKEGSEFYE